ncbi:MAG TPA: SGNH hydrolase domain-containing protein [Solirubrobacteraceae bacterium]|nr:SGNH hydrolase domain-containing protein [Solirubrobacteraceae bacterium]
MTRARCLIALAIAVVLIIPSAAAALTSTNLASDLVAGTRITHAPANVEPPLTVAAGAEPMIVKNGCHLSRTGLRSKPCVYGDTTSTTTVVVFGDSHAAYWFPALDLISRQQHWRLVDLTKDGCPAAEVNIAAWFRHGGPYPECTDWRRTAMAQIAALHPALVIVSEARYLEVPEARPLAGVPTGHGSAWLNGLAATFAFLDRTAAHAVFISDVPTPERPGPGCVSNHPSDVQACDTPIGAAIRFPGVKSEERELAERAGVTWVDPTSWFCTPTICPAIVGDLLVYRDVAHMQPAWARFISPLLADAIVPITGTA